MDGAEAVLVFWFAPGMEERWFEPDPSFDAEIKRRFGDLVERAAAGEFGHPAASAPGSLALCLLLDQFPRNIWRGTPRAFSCDEQALRVADGGDTCMRSPETASAAD